MLYRIMTRLDAGKKILPVGEFISSVEWKQTTLDKLAAVGAIAPMSTPPLAVLPETEEYADRLETVGIVYADQFLETPAARLAEQIQMEERLVHILQAQVHTSLSLPQRAEG